MRPAMLLGTATALLVFAVQPARADGWNAGVGYNFIPRSGYASLGYRQGNFAGEAYLMSLGREEPTTKPGPELSLDVLGYLPQFPVFVKAGVVAGWGKTGENVGIGVDIRLTSHWFARLQDTAYHATEDQNEGAETERIISLGLHDQF